ncbi:hypothetical protein ABTN98_19360, partial [Acinetobacter baumannii]
MWPELGTSAQDTATTIEIGKNEIGAPPAEFEFSSSGDGKPRSWTVVRDATASAGMAIEQVGGPTAEDHFALAI